MVSDVMKEQRRRIHNECLQQVSFNESKGGIQWSLDGAMAFSTPRLSEEYFRLLVPCGVIPPTWDEPASHGPSPGIKVGSSICCAEPFVGRGRFE